MDQNKINAQIERFRKGFPWLDIVAAATPQKGIKVLDEKQIQEAASYSETAAVDGKCKFVPASGAASRMFKDIFAGMEKPNPAVEKLAANLEKFAFYSSGTFGSAPYDPQDTARRLLTADGLDYGSKPKGVLKFHRYPGEVRTALAEHFVEGQAYMRNPDGSVNLVITISPEHEELFKSAVADIKDEYEARYGVKYNITFTYQKKETDTIAVDSEYKPFLKEDGSILTRPAGHGALIYNLNALDEELVSIKNIDNVCVERMHPDTYLWKKVLMGCALQLRDRIRGMIAGLDADPGDKALCGKIQAFLKDELCVEMPEGADAAALRAKLDRPIRVCGMVKNEGEPGGGPFIIRGKDGSTSLQILEGAQIDPENPDAVAKLKSATHFNPVDLVCCLKDHEGKKFDLLGHVDEETGLISSKSYQGRELKALELPGLWNGSMSDWNTLFVEVPITTFNPVKTVLDLLRPAHQA